MEALRVQLDNLKWEVNRLDVENRQLREADTEATQGPLVLATDRGLGGDMGAGIPDIPQDGGDVSQDGPDVSHVSQEPEREPGQWTGQLRRKPKKRNLSDEVV